MHNASNLKSEQLVNFSDNARETLNMVKTIPVNIKQASRSLDVSILGGTPFVTTGSQRSNVLESPA